MSFNGKTTQAKIMDACPGCPFGGLDLSRGLFDFFADESAGVIYGNWWFKDEGYGGPPPPPSPSSTEVQYETSTAAEQETVSTTSHCDTTASGATSSPGANPTGNVRTAISVAPNLVVHHYFAAVLRLAEVAVHAQHIS